MLQDIFSQKLNSNATNPFSTAGELCQRLLSHFNRERLTPGLGNEPGSQTRQAHQHALEYERQFVANARAVIAPMLTDVPHEPDAFVQWFESLQQWGPGQNDPLFPWL